MVPGLLVLQMFWSVVGRVCRSIIGERSTQQQLDSSSSHRQPLMEIESSIAMLVSPSIAAITFFDGACPLPFIRKRVSDIIEANPFLCGRLVGKTGKVLLEFPKTAANLLETGHILDYFAIVDDPNLKESGDVIEILRHASSTLEKLRVKDGRRCLNQNEALFRVVAINISPEKFAIAVFLSHVIADGCTFYAISGMLSETSAIYSMQVSREEETVVSYNQTIGSNDPARWLFKVGTLINMIYTLVVCRPPQTSVCSVDSSWIVASKAAVTSSTLSAKQLSVPAQADLNPQDQEQHQSKPGPQTYSSPTFVSTNDVITAAVFRLCKQRGCSVFFMATNLRGRVPGLSPALAGNYETFLTLPPATSHIPTTIRASLLDFPALPGSRLPQELLGCLRARICMVTSWATLYRHVTLPGCRTSLHLPLYIDLQLPWDTAVLVYCPRPGQCALLITSRSIDAVTFTSVSTSDLPS